MTQEEKLQSLKDWLARHKIGYNVNDDKEIDAKIVISKPQRIAVFICLKDEEELNFGAASTAKYKAFFIRETDTEDFVIEKMRNAIRGWNMKKVRKEDRKKRLAEEKAKKEEAKRLAEALKPKRKRIRVAAKPVYEKVEARGWKA